MMKKSRCIPGEKIAIIVFVWLPILAFAMLNDHPSHDREPLVTTTPFQSNPGDDPILQSGILNATFGYANITAFNFSITYQSDSNSTPAFINVTLVHEIFTTNYTLQKSTPAANNYVTGVGFHGIVFFSTAGNYSHYFTASNGVNQTRFPSTGLIPGPSIVWLRNYTMTEVPYRWLDSSQAVEPPNDGLLMYNYALKFNFTMYSQVFNTIQVSYYGFLRFEILPWTNFNRYPLSMRSTSVGSRTAI
nr:hypothetical protein [Candidatus Sigynarchaeota archaeon]